jgi:hypothetical protein
MVTDLKRLPTIHEETLVQEKGKEEETMDKLGKKNRQEYKDREQAWEEKYQAS